MNNEIVEEVQILNSATLNTWHNVIHEEVKMMIAEQLLPVLPVPEIRTRTLSFTLTYNGVL